MIFLSKYNILGKINGDTSDYLFRAKTCTDNKDVILKFPTKAQREYNGAALQYEYNLCRDLSGKGIPRYLQLETFNTSSVAILESVDGEIFSFFLSHNKLNIEKILQLTISIVEILELLHQKGIVHLGICPANFIINPDTLEINLLDLSNAYYSNIGNSKIVTGIECVDLAYISPEQTGRLKSRIDIRSELYSLGVILYEMATGTVPFVKEEALSLIHFHIAKKPRPPHNVTSDIPLMLSRIVLKLLAKNPDERYQSPSGLKTDLAKCSNEWMRSQSIELFELGKQDRSGTLIESKQFYGREKEMEALRQSFERISDGAIEIILIEGYSGSGKSALVHELKDYLRKRKGIFAEGKFDQFQKNIPYFGFIQAFKEFTDSILTQSPEKISFWKNRILQAVGNNGRVLTDIIPHLELLIGQQPQLSELGLTETQNRLHYFFSNFIKCVAVKEHPFVIFFDDVQWADAASLNLIKTICADKDLMYFLFIVAYRENEMTANTVFFKVIDELRMLGSAIQKIDLVQILDVDAQKIVAGILGIQPQESPKLVRLIIEKSRGNPFFIKAYLNCLYSEQVLAFDFPNRKVEIG